jgi:hypothetical protein
MRLTPKASPGDYWPNQLIALGMKAREVVRVVRAKNGVPFNPPKGRRTSPPAKAVEGPRTNHDAKSAVNRTAPEKEGRTPVHIFTQDEGPPRTSAQWAARHEEQDRRETARIREDAKARRQERVDEELRHLRAGGRTQRESDALQRIPDINTVLRGRWTPKGQDAWTAGFANLEVEAEAAAKAAVQAWAAEALAASRGEIEAAQAARKEYVATLERMANA